MFWNKKALPRDPNLMTIIDVPRYAEWCAAVAKGSTNMDWPTFRSIIIVELADDHDDRPWEKVPR